MGRPWKKLAALAVCVLLFALLIPSALAADGPAGTASAAEEWSGPSSDEMFTAYLRGMFYGPSAPAVKSPGSLAEKLGPVNYSIEQRLKAQIEEVASGERTNTEFAVDVSDLDMEGYSAEQLSVLYNAILADCTASLYWHDVRLGYSYLINEDETPYVGDGSLHLFFAVAYDYRSDAYEVDPDRITRAKTARENADAVIAQYSSASDVNKLRGYMYEICRLNVYNDYAADHGGEEFVDLGIDPWQLVNVFDGDPDTNVVCEGYSKAFEYLCNNTAFRSSLINCYCVSGSGHMWNIVRMDDGDNYAMDVTWSEPDGDYAGNPVVSDYAMFLSYAVSGNAADGYRLSFGSNSSVGNHQYYARMHDYYTDEELTISDHAYAGAHTHSADTAVRENVIPATCSRTGSCDEVIYCSVCGHEMSRTAVVIPKTEHTPGQAAPEDVVSPTCTEPGHHDMVVRCSVCQEEISRETVVDQATGHTTGEAASENEVAPTCTEPGHHDMVVRCTVCQEEISRETVADQATGHTAGEPASENEVAPTCTEPGHHDMVVRCSVCREEISRKTVTDEATGHTHGEAERENEVAPTCTEPGHHDMVVRCTVCREEISRVTVADDPLGHEPGEAVRENEVPATTESEGSYEEVIYCTRCGKELERTYQTIPVLPAAPVITTQPAAKTAVAGKTVSFSVKAEGEGLKYQWYVFKKGATAWTLIPGAESSRLTLTAKAGLNGYKYRCVVTNDGGSEDSASAKLTVLTKPKISTQPKSASIKAGRKVTFKVRAAGGELAYQWYLQKAGTNKWVKISKATKASYSFTASKSKNGYQYYCLVKNKAGSVKSKTVKLTVK